MYRKIIAAINPSNMDHGADILRAANRLLDDGGEIIALSVIEEIPDYVASQLPPGMVPEAGEHIHKLKKGNAQVLILERPVNHPAHPVLGIK